MKNMSLEKIAQACGGVYHGSEEMKQSIVESITTDSRAGSKGLPVCGNSGRACRRTRLYPICF